MEVARGIDYVLAVLDYLCRMEIELLRTIKLFWPFSFWLLKKKNTTFASLNENRPIDFEKFDNQQIVA